MIFFLILENEEAYHLNKYYRILIDKNFKVNALGIIFIDNNMVFTILGGLVTYGFLIYQTK